MKVELKKIQVYPRLSEETFAFNAEIHVDGRKVGDASNDGHGGSHRLYWHDRSIEATLEAWAATLPGWDHPSLAGVPMDLEGAITNMVADFDENKRLARMCKSGVVFSLKDSEPGTYWTLKTKDIAGGIAHVQAKYGDKIQRIVNLDLQ